MASQELLDWCTEGGVQWNGVEAGYVAEGRRGVVATKELAAGTCILRVPRRLLMSVESARRDKDFCAALQQCSAGGAATLTSEQVLAAHLLHEASKGAASFWHPYLRSLPRSYTTAMCFSEEQAAALQAAQAVAAALAAAAAAAEQHAGVLPLLRALRLAPKWRSRAAWLWAASTLSSRTMYMPQDAAGALTPFGDLHNYRPPPPPYTATCDELLAAARALHTSQPPGSTASQQEAAGQRVGGAAAAVAAPADDEVARAEQAAGELAGDGHLDEQADQYCLFACTGYRPGEQVFLCYGRHTNLELLQHYGFVLEGNPHDTAVLPPAVLPPAVRRQLNCSSGSWAGGADEGSSLAVLEEAYLHANGAPSWELLRVLRLVSASPAERKAGACRALADQPISVASERAAFEALLTACENALAVLPTGIEEDQRQLAALRATASDVGAAGEQEQREADAAAAPHGQQHNAASAAPVAADQPQQPQQQQEQRSVSERWAAEKLCVAVEWRLGYKRILQRSISLCRDVLAALPPATQNGSAGGVTGQPPPADLAARLAALQRTPRW